MEYKYLKYFQVVAHEGNMTAAANRLYISQPSLSKSITQLEKELGMPLFDRRRGQIQLNEIGKLYLTYVDRAMNELELGRKVLEETFGEKRHHIGISEYLPVVPDFLIDDISGHTDWNSVNIELCDTKTVTEHLRSKQSHIGLSARPCNSSDIISIKILTDEFVILAAPDHPQYCNSMLSLSELRGVPLVCSEFNTDLIESFHGMCLQAGFVPNIIYQFPGNTGFSNSVSDGNSLLIVPLISLLCKRNPAQRPVDANFAKTKILLVKDPVPCVEIYLSRHIDPFPHKNVASLYHAIQDFLLSLKCEYDAARQYLEEDNYLINFHKFIDGQRQS